VRFAAIALVAAAALAGCGDDEETTDPTQADTPTTTTVAATTDGNTSTTTTADDAAERLATALDDAGLASLASLVRTVDVDELLPDREFTFFAPDDGALGSLDSDELRDLLTNPDDVLRILRNHVIDERLESSDLADGDTLTTSAGEELTVSVDGATVTIGDATVVRADVEIGDQGVVHVVDGVLLPADIGDSTDAGA
jgi:uncharacterized surface protein with fasciclin (FAS1) repeats